MTHQITIEELEELEIETVIAFSNEDHKKLTAVIDLMDNNQVIFWLYKNGRTVDRTNTLSKAVKLYNSL